MTKTIYNIHKRENPFVQIDKTVIMDSRLSWKAKGILTYLLSRPDNWQVYETEIVKHAKDGRDSVSSGIKELIDCGYIERELRRSEAGHFRGYEYNVYEVPIHYGKPVHGKPVNGKPVTTNKEGTNKDLTKKDKRYIVTGNDGFVFRYYLQRHREKYDSEHSTVTYDQIESMKHTVMDIENEHNVDNEDWINMVDEHFKYLDKATGNDGSLLYFLSGDSMQGLIRRYAEGVG